MQNKERLMEMQSIYSRKHVGLLVAVLVFGMINFTGVSDYNYKSYVPLLVIAATLCMDLFFSYRNFFHKYKLMCFIRYFEVVCTGSFITCDAKNGTGGIISLITILFYMLYTIEFGFLSEIEERSSVSVTALIIQLPFFINIIILLINATDNIQKIASYILLIFMNFILYFAIYSYIGAVSRYQMESLFAKDRLLDRAKDNFDKIDENQHSLVAANEQLGIKKFELEEANKKVNKANLEFRLLNEILGKVSSSLDANKIVSDVNKIMINNFNIMYAGASFKNKRLENLYGSGLTGLLNEEEYECFFEFFFSSAFLDEHYNIGHNYINNCIDYEEFPYLKRAGVKSLIAKVISKEKGLEILYILFSDERDCFKGKETFFDTVFTQLSVAANNIILYKQVDTLSKVDGLSELYNRRYLNLYFNEKFIKNKNNELVSAAMLDIDHFKNINDTYGHLFGDQAIKTVASIIKDVCEENKIECFRYGGEEFVILLKNKDINDCYNIAELIRKTIKNTVISFGGNSLIANVSIGVTSYPQITKDISLLIDRADKAMYYSKQNGRDQTTIDNGED